MLFRDLTYFLLKQQRYTHEIIGATWNWIRMDQDSLWPHQRPELCWAPLNAEDLQLDAMKTSAIRSSPPPSASVPAVPPICPVVFESLKGVSLSALTDLVQKLQPSYCPLDSIPHCLLRTFSLELGPVLSFMSGCGPALHQKKQSWPHCSGSFKANLQASLSLKDLGERSIWTTAVTVHWFEWHFWGCHSWFKACHSAVGVLLKVWNDLHLSVDSGYSPRLDNCFWYSTSQYSAVMLSPQVVSFLPLRQSFFIPLGQYSPATSLLTCVLPQFGGHSLFHFAVNASFGVHFRKYNVSFHCFANDVQIYLPSKTNDRASIKDWLDCQWDVRSWKEKKFLNLKILCEDFMGLTKPFWSLCQCHTHL